MDLGFYDWCFLFPFFLIKGALGDSNEERSVCS